MCKDYESYQNKLTVENAEHYLKERSAYEKEINGFEALLEEIKGIIYDDEYYKNKNIEERLNDLKEAIEENDKNK